MPRTYNVTRRETPWLVVFTANTLEEAAESVAAQADSDEFEVYINDNGFSRDLNDAEQQQLAGLIG